MGCRGIGPGRRTPSWRCCAGIRPTACPVCRASVRRRRPPCWPSTVRWSGSWPPRTIQNPRWQRVYGRSCWPQPTTSRRPARWCAWPPTRRSRCRRPPTLYRWWQPTRSGPPSWRPSWVSGRRSAGCRRRSTRCPPERAIRLLWSADLVGALVVLEGHRHPLWGAVDADVAVERAALFDDGVLAVVALDVLDVLGAVAVRLVAEDLLHTGLRLVDVQFGGDEKPGLPETEHQHHRDEQEGDRAGHAADQRHRAFLAWLLIRRVLLRVLAGLTVLTGLAVLARLAGLPVLARLRVLPRLGVLTVLAGLGVLGWLGVVGGRGTELARLSVAGLLGVLLRVRLLGRLLVLRV